MKHDHYRPSQTEMMMWEDESVNWLFAAEAAKCNHPILKVDANVGPESGSEGFYCPVCGFCEEIIYY